MNESRGTTGPPIEEAIAVVRAGIHAACRRAGRTIEEVTLVAATKTVPVRVISEAVRAGVHDLAENHAADLAEKAPQIDAVWHFIGTLQTGTAARVADHADVIHSAEPGRAIERVARRADRGGREIRCLIQVDETGGRHGVSPHHVEPFLGSLSRVAGVRVVGLMTLPPWTGDPEATRPFFARLRELRDRLSRSFPDVVELSMGMSGDYQVAVEEGATMVRVGTALFGARPSARGTARRPSSTTAEE